MKGITTPEILLVFYILLPMPVTHPTGILIAQILLSQVQGMRLARQGEFTLQNAEDEAGETAALGYFWRSRWWDPQNATPLAYLGLDSEEQA